MATNQSQFPLRFSLRELFFLTTTLAFLCAVAVLVPVAVTQLVIGLIWIVAASLLVTGLFFAKGDQRAFCIGATVAVTSMWTGIGGRFMQSIREIVSLVGGGVLIPQSISLWLDLVILVGLAVANGLLCVRAKAYFERTDAPESR